MTDKIVVLSTCSSAEEAGRIARRLVESRLAACVNIMPRIRSVYRWKDAIEESEEVLLLIKSSRPLFDSLQAEIGRLHSYETPEAVALSIVDGSEPYLAWLAHELAPAGGEE
ncbi:MAG TPA: divalent-cation tolerance protein CutA [Bryobacteraceae bacterium]|nr:divalent-cation tolerance protein CutA [Bryobacteraceae bacterium]